MAFPQNCLLCQAVFGLDPVELFEHGFGNQPQEEKRGNGAHQIDRKAGNVIAKNNFPVDRVRPHEGRRGIHNAAVDDRGRDHAEDRQTCTLPFRSAGA